MLDRSVVVFCSAPQTGCYLVALAIRKGPGYRNVHNFPHDFRKFRPGRTLVLTLFIDSVLRSFPFIVFYIIAPKPAPFF
jgi:hypothetical protein